MNRFIHEYKIPLNYFNCFLYGINVRSFENPDQSLICWKIKILRSHNKQSDDSKLDEEMDGFHNQLPNWVSQ